MKVKTLERILGHVLVPGYTIHDYVTRVDPEVKNPVRAIAMGTIDNFKLLPYATGAAVAINYAVQHIASNM